MSTEIYRDAHRRAFEFFDGVPVRITSDNDRTLAAEILGAHERKLTEGFLQLKSHYLFGTHFCHARPLENGDLPECFAILRRRLEDERGGEGTREFIRVLRLLEKHSLPDLTRAVTKGLRSGVLIRDAIAQFLIPQEEWRQTTFRLDGHEHLRQVQVTQTNVAGYSKLLVFGGVR